MAPPPDSRPPSASGLHRLVLAGAAAAAVSTLCWAGLQVRAAKEETRALREQRPAIPPAPEAARLTELERRLAAAGTREKEAAATAAARVQDLEKVISFLRQEISAAQQTIERLSRQQAAGAAPP